MTKSIFPIEESKAVEEAIISYSLEANSDLMFESSRRNIILLCFTS